MSAELRDLDPSAYCDSCGKPADVELKDGSWWCLACDASARNLGYDDDPIVAMRSEMRP